MAKRNTTIQKFMATMAEFKRVMHNAMPLQGTCLPPAQLEVLWHVSKQTDMSIKDVATTLRVTPSAATQLIEPLVKEGYLLRNTDPADRRSVMLHISPVGKKVLDVVYRARTKMISALVAPLSDEELDTLVQLFDKMTHKIKEK